jgi:hypothetical protein
MPLVVSLQEFVGNTTVLVYHNAACPQVSQDRDWLEFRTLGRWAHVTQLNTAAIAVVAKRPRWHLVDFGRMSLPYCFNGTHLRDRHHPDSWFMFNVVNRYLNAIALQE